MAIGAMEAIKGKGLKIPNDIAVAGFDNIKFSEYVTPKLTTVSQPTYKIGEVAMKMLIKLMNEEPLEEENVFLEHEIIIRESC